MVATGNGVVTLRRQKAELHEFASALLKHRFTAVAANGEIALAGTVDGIYQSADFGRTWREASDGLEERHIRSVAFHPDDKNLAFAGTEPANIFVSRDGGHTWHRRPEVSQLRDEHGWSLPYSPAAGCIRDFAFHGDRAYAAAEQGGLLRSDDRGSSWYLAQGKSGSLHAGAGHGGKIHKDVHSVTVHPSSADQVFAPTGGGLYYSASGGDHWERLYACYCRAAWVDSNRPARLIFGPADGVDRGGRIEESIDGGHNWEAAMNGLTGAWPDHMVERFVQVGGELFAILSSGRVIVSTLDTWQWRPVLPALEKVADIAWIQGG